MSRFAQVIRPDIPSGRRVIAVSDIHGNLPFLKGLLERVRFSPEDVLILVGDLLEKGLESLATLRYVLELQKSHTVYALCGNCDYIDWMFLEAPPARAPAFSARMQQRYGSREDAYGLYEVLWPVLSFWRERSVLFQMAAEAGIPLPSGMEDLPALRATLLARFPVETNFLLAMPHILECGNFIFVHGGVPREDRLDELEAYPCMKNDDFMGQGLSFRKWVVVGHWPVTLYNPHIQQSNPIIHHGRHIASIDGGCVLKLDGQLNALIIPDINGDDLDFAAYDGLPVFVAASDQMPSDDPLNIRWSDSVVEPLRVEGDRTLCRHLSTGRELWIPTHFLGRRKDGRLHTEDATDYRLPVTAGERLGLICRTQRGCLVKKNGVTGWYFGELLEEPT